MAADTRFPPSALLDSPSALIILTSSSLFMTFLIRARGKLYVLKSGVSCSTPAIWRVQNDSRNSFRSWCGWTRGPVRRPPLPVVEPDAAPAPPEGPEGADAVPVAGAVPLAEVDPLALGPATPAGELVLDPAELYPPLVKAG